MRCTAAIQPGRPGMHGGAGRPRGRAPARSGRAARCAAAWRSGASARCMGCASRSPPRRPGSSCRDRPPSGPARAPRRPRAPAQAAARRARLPPRPPAARSAPAPRCRCWGALTERIQDLLARAEGLVLGGPSAGMDAYLQRQAAPVHSWRCKRRILHAKWLAVYFEPNGLLPWRVGSCFPAGPGGKSEEPIV